MSAASSLPPRPPPAHRLRTHVRATAVLLVLSIVLTGLAYPLLVTAVAQEIDPYAAGGSLLRCPNGTVVGSADIAQNLSSGTLGPGLFWARPSLTDYNTTLGAESPPGPSDNATYWLIYNETKYYLHNLTYNASPTANLPFWWVAPSASSVDPDLTPGAALVQIPRVHAVTNLSNLTLTELVLDRIVQPPLPYLGVPFVNVLELDIALLALEGRC
jgi:potassium-transporting ATPase KdpC subunit